MTITLLTPPQTRLVHTEHALGVPGPLPALIHAATSHGLRNWGAELVLLVETHTATHSGDQLAPDLADRKIKTSSPTGMCLGRGLATDTAIGVVTEQERGITLSAGSVHPGGRGRSCPEDMKGTLLFLLQTLLGMWHPCVLSLFCPPRPAPATRPTPWPSLQRLSKEPTQTPTLGPTRNTA